MNSLRLFSSLTFQVDKLFKNIDAVIRSSETDSDSHQKLALMLVEKNHDFSLYVLLQVILVTLL